jgi:hypothetical protein
MGTAFGVPEDVDEEELMGELEGLEDELAAEATTGGSVPAYLQVGHAPCCRDQWGWVVRVAGKDGNGG